MVEDSSFWKKCSNVHTKCRHENILYTVHCMFFLHLFACILYILVYLALTPDILFTTFASAPNVTGSVCMRRFRFVFGSVRYIVTYSASATIHKKNYFITLESVLLESENITVLFISLYNWCWQKILLSFWLFFNLLTIVRFAAATRTSFRLCSRALGQDSIF